MAQVAIRRSMLVITLVCVADLVLTLVLLASGRFHEGNPIMSFYLSFGPGIFCLMKAFFVLMPLFVAEIYRTVNPRLVASSLNFAVYGYVALYGGGFLIKNIGPLLF